MLDVRRTILILYEKRGIMAKLEVGKKAPAFTAIIADGKKVKLGDIFLSKGQYSWLHNGGL